MGNIKLTEDHLNILQLVVKVVNKASKNGKWEEQIKFVDGTILTITAVNPTSSSDATGD